MPKPEFFTNPHVSPPGPFPFAAAFPADGGAQAMAQISACPRYAITPLVPLPRVAAEVGVAGVWYKDEAGRFGLGSFKALGGAYAVGRILAERVAAVTGREPEIGALARGDHAAITRRQHFVCASDGNHGRAVAAGAHAFHTQATVFLHPGVSEERAAALRVLGADVVRTRGTYDDSVRLAAEAAAREGWILVSDTAPAPDGPDARIPLLVMEGYRVLAAEALVQLARAGVSRPSHVFLQAGVGGLAAAVTAHLWSELGSGRPRVIVVEPERADCLFRSARAGVPTPADGDLDTLMAGLACGEVSRVAWPVLAAGADAFMVVPDTAAVDIMRGLAEAAYGAPPLVAGESAVAGLAALRAITEDQRAALGLDATSHVLLVGTEGATDPGIYTALVGRPPEGVR